MKCLLLLIGEVSKHRARQTRTFGGRAGVGWILGYHSASLSPSAGQGRGDPNPPTCAYIYLSVDLLYSAIESSFPTDSHESGFRSVYH